MLKNKRILGFKISKLLKAEDIKYLSGSSGTTTTTGQCTGFDHLPDQCGISTRDFQPDISFD